MSQIMDFFNTLISQSEWRIFLQFILVISIFTSLFTVYSNRKLISQNSFSRAISSELLILCLQLLLFAGLYLNFRGILSLDTFLLSYSPFVFSISALWIIWLWCFPLVSMKSDGPKFALSIALIIIFLIQLFFTYVVKINNIDITKYTNTIWFLTILVILVFGSILLIFNHHPNWLFGCIFTFLHLIGSILALVALGFSQLQSNNILLFFQTIAFMILPVLAQSFVFTSSSEEKQAINHLPIASNKMSILPAQQVFQSWLNLAIKNQDILIASEFIRAIGLTFHADMALLIGISNLQDDGTIYSGFSLKRRKLTFPLPINNQGNHFINKYFKENKPFLLTTEDYFSNDLEAFLNLIKVARPINLLIYPIQSSIQNNNSFGIIFISSLLRWEKYHLDYLNSIKDEMVQIVKKIFPQKEIFNQQAKSIISTNDTEVKSKYLQIVSDESDTAKIHRLESELKLALEEYARIQKLLEENINRPNFGRNSNQSS